MKKLLVLISALTCIVLLAFTTFAAEKVVYLASGGTGDGSNASSPTGSLETAYEKIGGNGTIVVCNDFPISGKVNFPTHSDVVTITSVYGGTDYRKTNNAAFRFSSTGTINLHGPTVMDGLNIEVDEAGKSGVVIAANFNDVSFGYDFDIIHNYSTTSSAVYLTGGPNGDASVPKLAEGETIEIEIYGGNFLYFTPFSRSVQNAAHYGTAYVTLGGDAIIAGCYLGPITAGSTGGDVFLEMKDSALTKTLYLAGNGGGMNGDVTVDIRGYATVSKIDRYAASLFTNGTKTINVYGDNVTLPATLTTYFNEVNTIEEIVNFDVVYLSSGAAGDGSSAATPIGNFANAVAALGDDGGTVVLMSDFPLSTHVPLPAHSGTVTVTSVYDGIDYRKTNDAAFRFTASIRIVLGGKTVFDNLNFEIDSSANSGVVLTANFHDLVVGYGVEVIHNYTVSSSKFYVTIGSNNDANGNGLDEGEVCNVEIYSGDILQITGFSRGTNNKNHLGTVNLKVGGDAEIYVIYLGAVGTGATGGTINCELSENATVTNSFALSGNLGNMNGDVTVTVRDNATIPSIIRYTDTLHSGTKTINIYGDNINVPSSLETYFDVVNIYTPKDSITLDENIDVNNIVSILANGEAIAAEISSTDDGILLEYSETLENFTLSITVKDGNYTVYEYEVTETDGTANATYVKTSTYAGDVIFIGNGDGNGLTDNSPVSSISKAYELLIGNSGTFVICDNLTVSDSITAPIHEGTITVTSVYGSTDYRTSGAKLSFPISKGWQIGGETVFENITFDITTTAVISANFNPLVIGDGFEVINDYSSSDSNGLYLVGGNNIGSNTLSEYPDDTYITVRSGHIRCIIGFSRYCGARIHTGTSHINVEGDAYVRYVFGGPTQDSSISKNSIIKVRENAIVENLYSGGSTSDNITTGEVIIDVTEIEDGDIYEFDTVSINTSDGKVKLYYDPRTVPSGIVTMAEMARFDALSTCEVADEHTFGEIYASPFGGDLTAHTCEICDYTCLIEAAPEKVTDGVVFVADGGFGNGQNPLHPLGSLEDAFTALGNDGGTIVLVGECTLPVNLEWKFGATHVSFQEPVHAGNVLVTSVYGDVDYRESGAKLIFNGDMHYRLSGPTTFDHIVFDTVNNTKKTNLVAARYNPLVFGEDCKMNKTKADGYQFWVVGGYQYFRYSDFDGVVIDDPLLELVSSVRPLDWDFVPETNTNFQYTSGSGKTHTVVLHEEAAVAFSAMFADMAKEGLYIPYPSWPFRSAHTQYGIFSDSVGNNRVKGKDFATSYLDVAKSANPPGLSEHQLGLAFDIYDERLEETYGSAAHAHYHDTAEWKWITENGHKYGFIHRFPSNKTAQTGIIYEAWHFRYVGVEHATAIVQTDYCLEEYVGETIGLFDQDSSVTLLSGDFYQVMGGSRGCDNLTFTGTKHVTVGENANVTNLVDVDAEVGEEPEVTLGDANGDNNITLVDFIRIFKYTVDSTVEINKAAADVNADGSVDIIDALFVLKTIVNG